MIPGNKSTALARDESGQAVTEYVLLLLIVVMAYLAIGKLLVTYQIPQKMVKKVTDQTTYAYKYGDPRARGIDEGAPKRHPRWSASRGDNNFRLFYNPGN